jgi:hypothetical protein
MCNFYNIITNQAAISALCLIGWECDDCSGGMVGWADRHSIAADHHRRDEPRSVDKKGRRASGGVPPPATRTLGCGSQHGVVRDRR